MIVLEGRLLLLVVGADAQGGTRKTPVAVTGVWDAWNACYFGRLTGIRAHVNICASCLNVP